MLTETVASDSENDLPLNVLTDVLENGKCWCCSEIRNVFLNLDENLYVENPDSEEEIENPLKIQELFEDSDIDKAPTDATSNCGEYGTLFN